MCDNVFTIDDDSRRVTIQNNWYDYAQQVVTAFDIAKKPALWASSESLESKFSSVMLSIESEGAYSAYNIATGTPFTNAHDEIDITNGWISQGNETDVDWLITSSFIRNNSRKAAAKTVDRAFNYLDENAFYDLGRIGGKRVYAIKFIKAQHLNSDGTLSIVEQDPVTKTFKRVTNPTPEKLKNGGLYSTALGLFGYVTLQTSDAFLTNTLQTDLQIQPLSTITSAPFVNLCNQLIYSEIVLRFLDAQQIDKVAQKFGKAYVKVVSDDNPSFGEFVIPKKSFDDWTTATRDPSRTRLKLRRIVSTLPTAVTDTSRTIIAQAPTPATAMSAAQAQVPTIITQTPGLSKFSIALIIAAIICSVIGTVLLVMVMLKWLFSSKAVTEVSMGTAPVPSPGVALSAPVFTPSPPPSLVPAAPSFSSGVRDDLGALLELDATRGAPKLPSGDLGTLLFSS